MFLKGRVRVLPWTGFKVKIYQMKYEKVFWIDHSSQQIFKWVCFFGGFITFFLLLPFTEASPRLRQPFLKYRFLQSHKNSIDKNWNSTSENRAHPDLKKNFNMGGGLMLVILSLRRIIVVKNVSISSLWVIHTFSAANVDWITAGIHIIDWIGW